MRPVNLNRREKHAVTAAACCIVMFLVLELMVFPLLKKRERLDRLLTAKRAALTEIQKLQSTYFEMQKKADQAKASLAGRAKNFSLFSFLDHLNGEVDIRSNVSYMKPSSSVNKDTNLKVSTVELKLQGITTEQLTQYLYKVEYSGNDLYIKRMSISETSKPEGFVDVVLQVETVEA